MRQAYGRESCLESKKRNSLFTTWVVSYLAVLLLPLLFSWMVYHTAYGIIEKNISKINQITLAQTNESIDRVFGELMSTGRQILSDEKVLSLMYAPSPLTPAKLQRIGTLQSELTKKSAFGSYIKEIYVYFPAAQVAASTGGILKQESFEHTLKERFWTDFSTFASWSGAEGRLTVKLLRDPQSSDGGAQKVAVLLSDGLYTGEPDAVCMFILDARSIENLLESYHVGEPGLNQQVWAIAPDGRYLAPDAGQVLPGEILYDVGLHDGTEIVNIGSSKQAVVVSTSAITGWKLLSLSSVEHYAAQLRQIRYIYFAFLIFCLFAGAAISLYFSKKNYTPVRRMSDMFLKRLSSAPARSGDDFSILEQGLGELLKQNKDYEEQLDHQKKDLRQLWLVQMLRGKIHSEQTFRAVCTDYQLDFTSERFLVIGVIIEDSSALFEEKAISEDEDTLTMVNFMVASVLEELLQQDYAGYCCDYAGTLYCVVNLHGEPGEGTDAQLQEICRKAVSFTESRFDIRMQCYLSAVCEGMRGIHEAYKEVSWGLEQMESFHIETRTASREDIRYEAPEEPEAPLSVMSQQLSAAVAAGERAEALSLFGAILGEQMAGQERSFFYARLYTFSTLGEVYRSVLHLPAGEQLHALAAAVEGARTMNELRALAEDTFASIHRALTQHTEAGSSPVQVVSIMEYIDQNYSDPNLSVASISEQFSVSQSYLLRLFKKSVHTGVLEYISQKRVDEAKLLLKGTPGTVGEVAAAVGYSNSLALIRAFKKLEGVTPATYRKITAGH